MTSIKFEEKNRMADLTASLTSSGVTIEIDRPFSGDHGENCGFDLTPDEATRLGEFLIQSASTARETAIASLFGEAK